MRERMDRYPYHTRGGCGSGGKNSGGSAPPLEGPKLPLGWGKRKRLRCVKFSRKKPAVAIASSAVVTEKAAAALMNRRSVQSDDKEQAAHGPRRNYTARFLRNLDGNGGTRGGVGQERSSPTEAVNGGGGAWGSSEKGGSSSGSEGAAWPRIEIALTTQEKEEDFMAFKGTKLSLRPKKRAKPIQKSVNMMSPGEWLCDLSLERYQVREKKASKKVGAKTLMKFRKKIAIVPNQMIKKSLDEVTIRERERDKREKILNHLLKVYCINLYLSPSLADTSRKFLVIELGSAALLI